MINEKALEPLAIFITTKNYYNFILVQLPSYENGFLANLRKLIFIYN